MKKPIDYNNKQIIYDAFFMSRYEFINCYRHCSSVTDADKAFHELRETTPIFPRGMKKTVYKVDNDLMLSYPDINFITQYKPKFNIAAIKVTSQPLVPKTRMLGGRKLQVANAWNNEGLRTADDIASKIGTHVNYVQRLLKELNLV